jgi:hypothetical protein
LATAILAGLIVGFLFIIYLVLARRRYHRELNRQALELRLAYHRIDELEKRLGRRWTAMPESYPYYLLIYHN